MMPANTPALADAIWASIYRDVVGPTGQSQYILYDGSLVYRIPWQRGTTYNDICHQLSTTIASAFTFRCKYGKGNQGLFTSAFTNDIGWKAVEGKLLSCPCNVTWMLLKKGC